MLFLLSPAKTLDYATPVPAALREAATRPCFTDHAAELIALLKPKSPAAVARLMNLSAELAELNVWRYAKWSRRHTARNSRPAAWAFDGKALKPRIVECVFEDWRDSGYKVIGFFAKRARGAMARFAIRQRIATPAGLMAFDADGYAFDTAVSSAERLVFRRRVD